MDDDRFDQLTRRVGDLTLPRLPRRGLIGLLGGAALAGALGRAAEGQDLTAEKKCGNKGDSCDKKKCKNDNKKCCCKNLKCKNDKCKGSGSSCPTDASFNKEWGQNGTGNGDFKSPWGATTDPDGNVFVTDTSNSRVQAFNANGKFLEAFNGKDNNGNNKFITPLGIQFSSNNNGDVLFVADPGQSSTSRTLRQYNGKTSSSKFGKFIENDGTSGLVSPHDIAVDKKSRVWVVNMVTPGEVYLFDKNGGFTVKFKPSNQLNNPEGVATYTDNNNNVYVYVADTQNNRIVKFRYDSNNTSSGLKFIDSVGSSGSGDKNFNRPTGMIADECGNLFIADRNNARIQVFDKDLKFIDNFTRSFNNPTDVALGPDDDVLYVVDSQNNRIVKFDLS